MSDDVPPEGTDAEAGTESRYAYRRVSIYDLTPAHVEDAMARKDVDRMSVSSSSLTVSSHKTPQSWAIQPLDGSMDQLGRENPSPVERFAVFRSTPCVAPRELADSLSEYVTESRYIVASRKIQLSPAGRLSVVHLTHDKLLFAQVCTLRWFWPEGEHHRTCGFSLIVFALLKREREEPTLDRFNVSQTHTFSTP